MRNSVLLVLMAGFVMLAGCGGDDGNVRPDSSPPMALQPEPPTSPESSVPPEPEPEP